jgi:hypothetical protein
MYTTVHHKAAGDEFTPRKFPNREKKLNYEKKDPPTDIDLKQKSRLLKTKPKHQRHPSFSFVSLFFYISKEFSKSNINVKRIISFYILLSDGLLNTHT